MSILNTIADNYNDVIRLLPDYKLKWFIFNDFDNLMNSLNVNSLNVLNTRLNYVGLTSITEQQLEEEINFAKHIIGRLLVGNNFNIENSFKLVQERGWDHFYMFIDIHATILKPDYTKLAKEYYPSAKEVLQKLTKDKRIKLGLYTCSYSNEIDE